MPNVEKLRESISEMEAKLAEMKKELETAEMGIWRPNIGEAYFRIESDFLVRAAIQGCEVDISNPNYFQTRREAEEFAEDYKIFFMLLRLCKKSMENHKNERIEKLYRITYNKYLDNLSFTTYYTDDNPNTPFLFYNIKDAQEAINIIGKEKLIEYFKKYIY